MEQEIQVTKTYEMQGCMKIIMEAQTTVPELIPTVLGELQPLAE